VDGLDDPILRCGLLPLIALKEEGKRMENCIVVDFSPLIGYDGRRGKMHGVGRRGEER
jgi:hypothetical protein